MRITHYQLLGIQNTFTRSAIIEIYKKLALIWHPDVAKNWAPADQLAICEDIFKRISTAKEILSDIAKKNEYDWQLKIPLTPEESEKEHKFATQWETLNKIYDLYTERQQNPQAYIDYLQSQIIQTEDQSNKLMTQLHRIKEDVKKFPGILEKYKKQTDCKIDELNKNQSKIEHEMAQQKAKNDELSNQNKNLLKQIEMLQQQNLELRSRQASNNASYSTITAKESDNKFEAVTPRFFAFPPNVDVPMEVVNNHSKIMPTGLKTIYKIVDKFGDSKDHKLEFYGIKLVFENRVKAEDFRKRLIDFFEKKQIFSFNLLYDECFNFTPLDGEYIYKLQFKNCAAYFSSFEHPEKIGELLLGELEKYVEISNIPQEFRRHYKNEKVKDDELPENLKRRKI